MPRPADYIIGAGAGLGELSNSLYGIQDRNQKDLEKRDAEASRQALADPKIRGLLERVINGDDPEQVAMDHLVQEHLESQPSLTRQSTPGPFAAGYDKGPDTGPMIPYSSPVTGGRPVTPGRRGPMLDTSSLNKTDPGIQNRDVDSLMKLGGMMQDERRNNAMMSYREGQLGLGYDRLDLLHQKNANTDDLRRAQADYLRAKLQNMPEQMAQAARRVQIAEANLGMRGQALQLQGRGLDVKEAQAYDKMVGDVVWTVPAIDNLLMKARSSPGMAPPDSDYTMRQAATIAEGLPFNTGKPLKTLLNRIADSNLTQQQRDFRRQVSLALQPFRKLNVGTQITQGEFELINELAGQQLSIEDTVAGLAALRQSMNSRLQRGNRYFPNAAARNPDINTGNSLPPLSSGQANDPYGLGALSETPETDYFNKYGYTGGQ